MSATELKGSPSEQEISAAYSKMRQALEQQVDEDWSLSESVLLQAARAGQEIRLVKLQNGRLVIAKLVYWTEEGSLEPLANEVEIAFKLTSNHHKDPNLLTVPLINCSLKLGGKIYGWYLMPYYHLGTLFDVLSSNVELSGQAIYVLARSLLAIVDSMHKLNIAHRDLKTTNIFVEQDGSIRIGDFNISKCMKKSSTSYTFAGTATQAIWAQTKIQLDEQALRAAKEKNNGRPKTRLQARNQKRKEEPVVIPGMNRKQYDFFSLGTTLLELLSAYAEYGQTRRNMIQSTTGWSFATHYFGDTQAAHERVLSERVGGDFYLGQAYELAFGLCDISDAVVEKHHRTNAPNMPEDYFEAISGHFALRTISSIGALGIAMEKEGIIIPLQHYRVRLGLTEPVFTAMLVSGYFRTSIIDAAIQSAPEWREILEEVETLRQFFYEAVIGSVENMRYGSLAFFMMAYQLFDDAKGFLSIFAKLNKGRQQPLDEFELISMMKDNDARLRDVVLSKAEVTLIRNTHRFLQKQDAL